MRIKFRLLIWEWRGILIAAPSVAFLAIALRLAGLLQLIEWAALDRFFRLRPIEPLDARIVIVTIDEPDIRKVGQWPIPDATLAKLLEKLRSQQPRAIGLDIYRDLRVEPGHQELIKIFESTPNLIGVEKVVDDSYSSAVAPPPLLNNLNQVAAIDVVFDADGKVRRGLLTLKPARGKLRESLAVRLALTYLKAEGINLELIDKKRQKLRLGKAVFVRFTGNDGGYVRADAGGYQILLNYRSHPGSFRTVSMTDVLEDKIPSDLFSDRLVLIGITAQSLNDFYYTPYSSSLSIAPKRMAGVEIQANLTSQIVSAAIEGRPLIQTWNEPVEWLWIFAWSWVGAALGWRLRSLRQTAYFLLVAGGSLMVTAYAVFLGGWWIPVVPSLLTLVGSAMAIALYIARLEREERQTLMSLFERHVTPKVAQAIWRDRHQLLKEGQLLGQQMTATVLFSDLKGFTTIAERTEPAALMAWLNEYMNAMAVIVLESDGVVDKFIGDAIMAVFGVPIPRTDSQEIAADAIAAVECAIAMGEKLRSLNQQWQERGRPTVSMRVGIATGTVVTGSLGCPQRVDYTTIGDSVNVAARLESYDKSLGSDLCRILISEETYHYIQGKFPAEFLVRVRLTGREQPIKIYQIPFG